MEDYSSNPKAEPPHEALFLVLPYLPVRELLAMSEVCVSLRDAINKDVLPWLNLVVQTPLNSRLSDDIFIRLAANANGGLRALVLINCIKITDYGLHRVIQENPFINKLYIPSCTGITPEGVVKAVTMLCQGSHSLSTLQINGIHNLKKEHLDMISSYIEKNLPLEPLYYHERSNLSAFREDDETRRTIDVGICPKCFEVRMVYDCPRETCKKREESQLSQYCMACNFCIPRCENCGRCIIGSEEITEEGACGDNLCSECWLQLPKCNSCNKPYCKQHTDWCCMLHSESGFICRVCNEENLGYMSSNDVL